MIDMGTEKVVLSKPVRRKTFVLGRSVALEATTAAVMEDGTLRIITKRRAAFFENRPLHITWQPGQWRGSEGFGELVQWLRDMERDYITEELPEVG
ncbi:hypothetical protein ACWEVY_28820 [Streptomyces longwoodensis]